MYYYNALGQRTRKEIKGDADKAVFYHYDLNGLLLPETSAKNKPGLDYVWLENRPLAQLKSKLAGKKSKLKTAEIVYLHSDHLNTPRLGSDKEAEIVWRWESDAFGVSDATVLADNEVQVNLRFPGQYFDRETGLYYNWNRYYDSEMGRYITSDPIGLAGGLNTYGYVGGNPLRFVDSFGLSSKSQTYYVPRLPYTVGSPENIAASNLLTQGLDALSDTMHDALDSVYEMSRGNKNVKSDEFSDESDEEVTRKSKDKTLPSDVRQKYITEDKGRKNRNKNKRKKQCR